MPKLLDPYIAQNMASGQARVASPVHQVETSSIGQLESTIGAQYLQLKAQQERVQAKREADEDALALTNGVSEGRSHWIEALEALKGSAPADGAGLTARVEKSFDDWRNKALEAAPYRVRERLNAELGRLRLSVKADAFAHEMQLRRDATLDADKQGAATDSKVVYLAPNQLADVLARRLATIDTLDLPPAAKQDRQTAVRGQLALAAAEGEIDRNPDAFLRRVSVRDGDQAQHAAKDDLLISNLGADSLRLLRDKAQRMVDARVARAQHEAEKRERTAERAVDALTRQIEAGVPVSIQGWQDLRGKVAGTASSAQFNALVTQEREVQHVLRMPIGQQETYVQQREARLMQEGGTMVDRSNIQRIRATIETNKKELEQAPLQAAQRLLGRDFEPVDFAGMLEPGGAHRTAAVFADRTSTLQAMTRQFGARVGQKPLFPQEVAALTSALDRAGPSDAVKIFSALRSSIDDDGAYQAVMQQIAPDSPVRARAGMVAASGRHVTLQSNWISDDVRVPGTRIAQTMMAGEAIINRSRMQKAEDGNARTLFTPPRQAFAQSFADSVGNLYRGRPGAQEQDLQAAYAYYVGKAAELGKTSDGAVDQALGKEAITATLGAVVNLNGQGHVKAPLGMSSSEFTVKARERFAQEVRRRNLPTSMLNEWPHYGLQDYRRDGTYVLTVGGQPVVDPATRTPVVIDMEPPPPSGSRYRSAADLIPKEGGAR